MSDIFRTAVSVNGYIIQENVFKHLRYACFILRSNDEARSDAVAAEFLLAILNCGVLSEHIYAGLGTGVSGRA